MCLCESRGVKEFFVVLHKSAVVNELHRVIWRFSPTFYWLCEVPELCPIVQRSSNAVRLAKKEWGGGFGGWRKQHNYDEMQQACSVITKQTADPLGDSGLSSYEKAESDRKPVGTPPPGVILYILSSYMLWSLDFVQIIPRTRRFFRHILDHKNDLTSFLCKCVLFLSSPWFSLLIL